MKRHSYRGVFCILLTILLSPMGRGDNGSASSSGTQPLRPAILDSVPVRSKSLESSDKKSNAAENLDVGPSFDRSGLPFRPSALDAKPVIGKPFNSPGKKSFLFDAVPKSDKVLDIFSGGRKGPDNRANKTQSEIVEAPVSLQDLKEISFHSLYPVAVYQKSYFSWLVLSVTILISCVVTYFTAGGGIPAAATGVSTVASWIAGGGAGSYMAGLATVGSCIGGNAMAGAAILNGISFAMGGTVAKTLTYTILSAAFFTATMIDGVAPLMKPEAGRLHYTVRITPPAKVGSVSVQKLVEEIQTVRERQAKILKSTKAQDAKNIELKALEAVSSAFTELMKDARDLLKSGLEKNNITTSDLLVLAIINYGSGEENSLKLFQDAVARISKSQSTVKNASYLKYLMAISCLCDGNEDEAMELLIKAIAEEPSAIEPAVLRINLLAPHFREAEPKAKLTVNELAKHFSVDAYKGEMTLIAPYYRLATIYYSKGYYKESNEYYSKALSEVGVVEKLMGDPSLRREIQLGIMNSLYNMGELKKATELYGEVASKLTYSEEKNFKERYAGK